MGFVERTRLSEHLLSALAYSLEEVTTARSLYELSKLGHPEKKHKSYTVECLFDELPGVSGIIRHTGHFIVQALDCILTGRNVRQP